MKRNKQILIFFLLIILLSIFVFTIDTTPLTAVSLLIVCSAILTYIFNAITKEYSWTDRLWSTLPIVIAWLYFYKSKNQMLLITASLITIWGIRLTFNFARKGGYSDKEDYRWSFLRKQINSNFKQQLFSLFFIAFYQQFLFICFTLPLNLLNKTTKAPPLSTYLFILISIVFLAIETVADQQQWIFQESKYGKIPKRNKLELDYKQGFLSTGLFSISRHPNYFGELGFWFSIYFICSSAVNEFLNWTIIGPILLTLLFVGSVIFTENISQTKYEDYKTYKSKVSPIVPLFWKKYK